MPKKFAQSKISHYIQRIKVLICPKNLILRILMFAIIYRRLQKMRYYRVSVTNRERLLCAPGIVLIKTTLTGRPFPALIKTTLTGRPLPALINTSTGHSSVQTALIRPSCLHLATHLHTTGSFYPMCTYAMGLSNQYCPSVSQFFSLSVCQSSEKFLHLNIDRIKQFVKPTVALTL